VPSPARSPLLALSPFGTDPTAIAQDTATRLWKPPWSIPNQRPFDPRLDYLSPVPALEQSRSVCPSRADSAYSESIYDSDSFDSKSADDQAGTVIDRSTIRATHKKPYNLFLIAHSSTTRPPLPVLFIILTKAIDCRIHRRQGTES
jgi:hypothetical protein